MVKKQKHQVLDEHLFRQEVGDVVPLKTQAKTDSKAPRSTKTSLRHEVYSEDAVNPFTSMTDVKTNIDSIDGSAHRKNGVQKRTMQKLIRGRFATGAELDLHNMTVATGQSALLTFIDDALSRSLESVRIIHGKGLRSEKGPRLKIMTRQVLRDHPKVLAYTNCKPADGGDGAVNVLLKSS